MALFDHDTKKILLGVGIGVGSALAIPAVASLLAVVGRPLVKASLKHGLLAAERSRERLAVLAEGLEDLIAEVRAEVEEELASRSTSAPPEESVVSSTDGVPTAAATPRRDKRAA